MNFVVKFFANGWQVNWMLLPETTSVVETKYYSFAGQRIAMRKDGMLTYLHSDHLGSTRLTTDMFGKQDGSMYYRAYGLQRGGDNVATENQFTGQKQDGSGLQYFAARYYDPALGTFISPDTIVPDAGNVFDYNRFMYVRGNAMNATDPSGHVSTEEACKYFGACGENALELFEQMYGNELAELLYNTPVGFGDLVSWGDNVAMLVLINLGDGNGHFAGLWGVGGDVYGKPVYLSQVDQSANFEQKFNYKGGAYSSAGDLPVNPDFVGTWHPANFADISELWWINMGMGWSGAAKSIATKGLTKAGASQVVTKNVGKAVDYVSKALPFVSDKLGTIEDLNVDMGYYWDRTLGSAWVNYPVVNYSPNGSIAHEFSLLGPQGKYK